MTGRLFNPVRLKVSGPSEYAVKCVVNIQEFCLDLNFSIICSIFFQPNRIHPSISKMQRRGKDSVIFLLVWVGVFVTFFFNASKIKTVTAELHIKPGTACSLVNN